jgi:hypothetical protein
MKANNKQYRRQMTSNHNNTNTPVDRALGLSAPSKKLAAGSLSEFHGSISPMASKEDQLEAQAQDVLKILARSMAADLTMNHALMEIRASRCALHRQP